MGFFRRDNNEYNRKLAEVRHDLDVCLGLKPTIDEAGYDEDEEMIDAFSIITKVHKELESEFYTAAGIGIKKTIDQLEKVRDQELAVTGDDLPVKIRIIIRSDTDGYARKQGFSECFDDGATIIKYRRNPEEKAAYDKRIKMLSLLQSEIDDRQGSVDDIHNRFFEIATKVSGHIQSVYGMHGLITEGRDRISLAQREEISKIFEPVDF